MGASWARISLRASHVWLELRAVATAKTASTLITGATAEPALITRPAPGAGAGVVSLGFDADGKRIRRKVSGKTRTEVKDKLKALHSELDAEPAVGVRDDEHRHCGEQDDRPTAVRGRCGQCRQRSPIDAAGAGDAIPMTTSCVTLMASG